MNERFIMAIIEGLSMVIFWIFFNKIEKYLCETKSKKLKIAYFGFAVTSFIASIIISTFPYAHDYYAVYILKGYPFGVSASLWSYKNIKEKSQKQ